MIRRFFIWINDRSIRYKLFITYLALITLPICLFLVINMYYTTYKSEQQTLYSLQQVQSQTKSFLEFKAESAKNMLDMLVLNDTLMEIATKDKEYYAENIGYWINDSARLTKIFYVSQFNPDLTGMTFYMRSGLASLAETDEYKKLSGVEGTEWFKNLIGSGNRIQWIKEPADTTAGTAERISAVKGIVNAQDINTISGVIRLDIPVSILSTALDRSLLTKSTSSYLVNSNNEIICSSLPGTEADISGYLESILSKNPAGGWVREKISDKEYLLETQQIKNTDWRLITAVPYKDIRMVSETTRNQMLLILLIVAPLTLPLSFIVSASATKRIRKLISHMGKAVNGDFNISILPSSNDEIGQLTRNFNYMLTKISMLIDEKFEIGQELKSLELKSLQAQINPHFLYNTLDLIDWISIKNNSPEASRLVKSLSRFYKLSLSNGRDIVTIRNEIEHVKAYVQIQNMRFEDKIRLVVDIPEDIYNYSIPKIILQPLVENSIIHGILENAGEEGMIKITGKFSGEDIILSVHDDGAGMSEEILSDIPAGVESKESHGYGVRNIDERLKLYFGKEYGLSYNSEENIGTTVEIRIKAILAE